MEVNSVFDVIDRLKSINGFGDYFEGISLSDRQSFVAILAKALKDSDHLSHIFSEQKKLDKHILSKKASYKPEIKDILFQLVDEVFEAKAHIKSKWWKDSEVEDLNLFAEEMVDVLHFYVSALLMAGFSADNLYSMYMEKNSENHDRAESGY